MDGLTIEEKIHALIPQIQEAFKGVTLEQGISWREANVLDDYGTEAERKKARDLDEQNDWTKIPQSLLGDLKYQDVIPFLDARGLQFYLAPCMIFSLQHYTTSSSLIVHSLIYNLTHANTAIQLQKIITDDQKDSIVHFLKLCIEIGDGYFDLNQVEARMEKYWIHKPT